MNEFSLWVKELRESLDKGQKEFADFIGVDQSTVSRWEKSAQPRLDQMRDLEAVAAKYGFRAFGKPSHGTTSVEIRITLDGLSSEDRKMATAMAEPVRAFVEKSRKPAPRTPKNRTYSLKRQR